MQKYVSPRYVRCMRSTVRITVDAETGFPLFSSGRPVTSDDVRAMEDEE